VKRSLVRWWAGVVGLAWVAGSCHGAAGPAAAITTNEAPNLRVLTWNLQLLPTALDQFSTKLQKSQQLRAPWIIDYLNHQDYDIIVLEEVIDPGITDQLKRELRAHYPYLVAPASKSLFENEQRITLTLTCTLYGNQLYACGAIHI
jgi:hypothetical protein